MRTSCTGTHWCEPPRYPDSLDETWACQICGRLHYAFDVHADADEDDRWLQHVPEGTLGWTTRKAGETR